MKKKVFGIGFLMLLVVSCNHRLKKDGGLSENPQATEAKSHGYNELANENNQQTFTISDFNQDNPDIENIARPEKSILKTNLDTANLFGIWTSEPDGPHADFELTQQFFKVVDYDGNSDMPYELNGNQLKVYYNDFIQDGAIISISKDTLKIKWKSFDHTNNYVRWTQ